MAAVEQRAGSNRAAGLAAQLRAASDRLIAVIEPIDGDRWRRVPGPGVWSVGREAEHVAEATVYHQWIVRLTIGEKVSSRRPVLERKQLTPNHSPAGAVELLRQRTGEGVHLLSSLTDAQLDLPTRPPRARGWLLAQTIELVLIDHFDGHRGSILEKLRMI
jgi:uncharacterized damage-inducible protein DinB